MALTDHRPHLYITEAGYYLLAEDYYEQAERLLHGENIWELTRPEQELFWEIDALSDYCRNRAIDLRDVRIANEMLAINPDDLEDIPF